MPLPLLCYHCASFDPAIASMERSLWRPLCLHSTTTATVEPPWRCFCLHAPSFAWPIVPQQQFWWLNERTMVVVQQLHRNRNFWVRATPERPSQFSGRSAVARRSQPCVKGVWAVKHLPNRPCEISKPRDMSLDLYCHFEIPLLRDLNRSVGKNVSMA